MSTEPTLTKLLDVKYELAVASAKFRHGDRTGRREAVVGSHAEVLRAYDALEHELKKLAKED